MRFDDRIATVMALPATTPGACSAKWRQLVDLLAQRRNPEASAEVEQAYAFLVAHRGAVDIPTRQEIARSLTGRDISPALLGFFAEDHPSVAAPLVAGALLGEEEWVTLSGTVDAVPKARPQESKPDPAPEGGEAQIRELVARIEAFR